MSKIIFVWLVPIIILLTGGLARGDPVSDNKRILAALTQINVKLARVDRGIAASVAGHEERLKALEKIANNLEKSGDELSQRISSLEQENFALKLIGTGIFGVLLAVVGGMNLNIRSWRQSCDKCNVV
jgi:hypothetical protein